MIQYANIHTRADVRQMWKTVFGDCDEYMDIYFREKYADERTLIYLENEKPVASLQMLPYNFTFCGTEIEIAYMSGVCTLPEARKKGYMHQLLLASFDEMHKRKISVTLLVPQDEWLLKFYDKYGFAQTFSAGNEKLPSLKLLTEQFPGDLHAAYREFNTWFRQKDMTVQKTFDDFRAIVEEAALFDFPDKHNLIGMARIIDVEALLCIFATRYEQKTFSVVITDEQMEHNNATFSVSAGTVKRNDNSAESILQCNIREITQWLFGYRTSQMQQPLQTIFPEKKPQMNFMLE